MAVTKNLVNIGDANITGDLTAGKISKNGGTSSQFLKADGSVDSNSYSTTDTKNTTGTTAYSGNSALYFVGATSKAASPQTYSASGSNYIQSSNNSYRLHAENLMLHGFAGNAVIETVSGATITISGGSAYFNYSSGGSVYIGNTSSPTTLRGSTITLTSDTVSASGKINAVNGFFQTSDITKKNVKGELDLDKAYELIDKCQTIIYSLKDDESNKEQIGLIAQEVKEFFPEIISESEDGTLSLDYSRLTVVILKVLKDLIKRVSKLEEKTEKED